MISLKVFIFFLPLIFFFNSEHKIIFFFFFCVILGLTAHTFPLSGQWFITVSDVKFVCFWLFSSCSSVWKAKVLVIDVAERSRSLDDTGFPKYQSDVELNVLCWTDRFALEFGCSQALLFGSEPAYTLTVVGLCPYILFYFPQRAWSCLQVKSWFVLIFPSCGGWDVDCGTFYFFWISGSLYLQESADGQVVDLDAFDS